MPKWIKDLWPRKRINALLVSLSLRNLTPKCLYVENCNVLPQALPTCDYGECVINNNSSVNTSCHLLSQNYCHFSVSLSCSLRWLGGFYLGFANNPLGHSGFNKELPLFPEDLIVFASRFTMWKSHTFTFLDISTMKYLSIHTYLS